MAFSCNCFLAPTFGERPLDFRLNSNPATQGQIVESLSLNSRHYAFVQDELQHTKLNVFVDTFFSTVHWFIDVEKGHPMLF